MREQSVRMWCGLCMVLVLLAVACGPKKEAEVEPPELTLSQKMRMAESMRNAGRMNDALEILRKAIVEHPEVAQLHSLQGQYFFLAGRYPDSETALLVALELDPYLTDARNWLGVTYAEQGNLKRAEEEYLKALEDRSYPSPEK